MHNMRMNPDMLIKRLIQERTISTQAEFLDLLHQYGWEVNQSTLSRHLNRLGIKKIEGQYSLPRDPVAVAMKARLMTAPPNLIIVRTRPGHAQAAAYRIDAAGIEFILGSVGGDDTVFVATKPEHLDTVYTALDRMFDTESGP
ncbi:MAG: arginine repressor [Acidobacteria bacterium]|nr:arginine repressor [Acidobacteriota bacterium]